MWINTGYDSILVTNQPQRDVLVAGMVMVTQSQSPGCPQTRMPRPGLGGRDSGSTALVFKVNRDGAACDLQDHVSCQGPPGPGVTCDTLMTSKKGEAIMIGERRSF